MTREGAWWLLVSLAAIAGGIAFGVWFFGVVTT